MGKSYLRGELKCPPKKLSSILPDAIIAKLDVEGAEFEVQKSQIEEKKSAHTWIIEVHTNYGEPEKLVSLFDKTGYKVHGLDKDKSVIEEYKLGNSWNCHHTTIFAQKQSVTL